MFRIRCRLSALFLRPPPLHLFLFQGSFALFFHPKRTFFVCSRQIFRRPPGTTVRIPRGDPSSASAPAPPHSWPRTKRPCGFGAGGVRILRGDPSPACAPAPPNIRPAGGVRIPRGDPNRPFAPAPPNIRPAGGARILLRSVNNLKGTEKCP
jgi:hypothetical protein